MADYTRSIRRSQTSAAATFSKKFSNVRSFSDKAIYDDVFAATPKTGARTFSSRVENYSEIFGSSRSSIPVLDLPAFDKREVSPNVRSSKFDYSKVFGGFDEVDFAVSYEELFKKPKDEDKSPEKARTSAETRPPLEGSDLSNCLEEIQVTSHEASYQSFDGTKQFNVSYHKTNQRSEDGTNGTTHIAQLHAVPGFTCIIGETTTLQNTEGDKPVPSVNNVCPTGDTSEGIMKGKHCRKATSHLPNYDSSKQASEDHVKIQSECSGNEFHSNDSLSNAYKSHTKARRSKVTRHSSLAPNFKVSESDSPEGTAGDCSPTYFDEELDINSAAAASVAALKKAIQEAQAKIKIAKELTERKMEGLQSGVKQNFKDGVKVKEGREGKIAEESNRHKEKRAQETCERENIAMQDFAGMTRQVAPNFRDSQKHFIGKEAMGEITWKESNLTSVNHKRGGARDGKGAKQSNEFLDTGNYREATQVADGTEKMMQSIDEHQWKGRKVTRECSELPELDDKKLEAVDEPLELEEFEKKINAMEEAQKQEEAANKSKSAEEICGEKDNEEIRIAQEQEETGEKLKASCEQEQNETKQQESQDPIGNEMKPKSQIQEENENKERIEEVHRELDFEMEWREVHEQEDNGKILKEVCGREENEEGLKVLCEQEECEKRQKQAFEWVEYMKKPKESGWLEENEEKQKDAHQGQDYKMGLDEVNEQGMMLNYPIDKEEGEKRLKWDCELEGYKKLEESQKQEENDKILKDACPMGENDERGKEAYEWKEIEGIHQETHPREENEKIEVTEEALRYEEKNCPATDVVCKQDGSENLTGTQDACRQKVNNDNVEVTQGVLAVNWRMAEATKASSEPKTNEESKTDEVANEQEENDMLEADCLAQSALEHRETENNMIDESEAFLFGSHEVSEAEENEEELKAVNVAKELEEKGVLKTACLYRDALDNGEIENNMNDECEALLSDDSAVNLGQVNLNVGQKHIDQDKNEFRFACSLEEHMEKLAREVRENDENVMESEVGFDREEGNYFKAAHGEEQWVENGKETEAAQLASVFEGKGETSEIAQKIVTDQSTEHNKENLDETLTIEDTETKENLQKVHLQKEHLRNIDEAKEREREKEKIRLAVERAIREARERAFAEARERAERAAAERATAEARQRVMDEARGRLEKASAETKDKSLAEKASTEAKRRAERAAVERATAEARERALEKALSEKAAFQARERAERSVAEKFSGASRDNGMQKSFSFSDPQHQGSVPSSSSSYSNASDCGVPSGTEGVDDGASGEPAQRYKAELEKHQRIAERAAKALAEKNMRDLLAQKEQAERNRLAETLDADIKRWSSGKTGNLRALLSTLQYILGPDSGWQPIPLIDIITTDAVKKAYRKATLFVHPDKLQQRGASIQQKYICEKVFDLLKEAWNKFNSEER